MSSPFIGEIRMFGGTFAPRDFAFCNGFPISIAQNTALFSLLGTTYGGNGTTTFFLPDLQGRIPVHQGAGFTLGQKGGTENETLSTNQIPSHTHDLVAAAGGTKQASPSNAWLASGGAQQFASGRVSPTTGTLQGGLAQNSGGQPHSNLMPFQAVSFIICQFGVFPSRN